MTLEIKPIHQSPIADAPSGQKLVASEYNAGSELTATADRLIGTNGSGAAIIAHGMPRAPSYVVGTARGTHQVAINSIGASDLAFNVLTSAGAAVVSTSVTIDWVAWL